VSVDIMTNGDSPYFTSWRRENQLEDTVRTYWGVDQADREQLTAIVDREFGDEPLDLVIDDASHLYAPTKASFEVLFPRLRPGGLYIIEDWATDHHPAAGSPDVPPVLGTVIHQLVGCVASIDPMVRQVTLFRGMAAIERGKPARDELEPLRLEEHIHDRRGPTNSTKAPSFVRAALGRLRRPVP
jgi:hypothetical protein